ncbi:MAG: hypothetical protein M9882_06665 [Homoserinimonas sp.]|nr:hypothetical protein [Homoserinimonas sp.]
MNSDKPPKAGSRPWQLTALAAVVFVEAGLCLAAVAWLVFELFTQVPSSLSGAIFILLLTVLATVWLGFVALNTLRAKPWIRGAVLTWQILQLAVAIGSFQGYFARDDFGWILLIPVVVAVVLLFTPAVLRATTRD